jgi:protein-tyrosine phosphatase
MKIRYLLPLALVALGLMSCKTAPQADVASGEAGLLLPLTGAFNIRDAGGYKTTNGKIVKTGLVFRADELNHLTDEDIAYLNGLNITSVVDFRSDEERGKAQDKEIPSVQQTHIFSIEGSGDLTKNPTALAYNSAEFNAGLLIDMYKTFPTDNQEQFKQFFALLQDAKNEPLLFHCTAGKDRTGFASAMFLYALGVDRGTILEDYLLSGVYLIPKYAQIAQVAPTIMPVFETHREYLDAAFTVIETQYGSVDKFLTNQLGVDIKKLRKMYLK